MDDEFDELLPVFLEEAKENIEKSHQTLDGFNSAADKAAELNNLARYIHTIKGGSSTFGFNDVIGQAHELENRLQKLKENIIEIADNFVDTTKLEIDLIEDLLMSEFDKKTKLKEEGTTSDTDKTEVSSEDKQPESITKVQPKKTKEFLRIPLNLVSESLNNIWEIFLIRNQMVYFLDEAKKNKLEIKDVVQDWELLDASLRRNITELEAKVMAMRMTSVKAIFSRMSKVIRNYSSTNNEKDIQIKLVGEDIEIDKKISDMLGEPLIHLIRNAMDHGIEKSVIREEMGKEPFGTITIEAVSAADSILILIHDDGGGINPKVVAHKALEKGIISDLDISEEDAVNLIFAPGFSTANVVSDVSGRGVGMDSVKSSVAEMGGSVSVSTKLGKGSVFKISLPSSLSVVSVIVVYTNGQKIGINITDIIEILHCAPCDFKSHGNEIFIKFRSMLIPCYNLDDTLSTYQDNNPPEISDRTDNTPVIIINVDNAFIAVRVSAILGSSEQIVKPIPALVTGVNYSDGMSILPTGEPIFVISLNKLAEKFKHSNTADIRVGELNERVS